MAENNSSVSTAQYVARVPRLFYDEKNRPFIISNKEKVLLQSDSTPKEIIDWLKENVVKFTPRAKGRPMRTYGGNEQTLKKELEKYHSVSSDKTDQGLFDYQINALMSKWIPYGYMGTFPIDRIPEMYKLIGKKKRIGFVMGTQPSNQSFTHWVAVYIDARPGHDAMLAYIDSLGEDPPPAFWEYIKPIIEEMSPDVYLKTKINKIVRQGSSQLCGYHAIDALRNLFAEKSFKFATKYTDIRDSEKKLKQEWGLI